MGLAQKSIFLLCVALSAVCFSACPVFADKSSVSIEAPASAPAGSTITITVTISHSGNNMLHYTKWVHVLVNGKEIGRWDYSWNNRPESAVFTKQIQYTVSAPAALEAEASCNIHGSKGPARTTVSIGNQ